MLFRSDYRRYIDDRPVFRQFFCPGCGALIENEIARTADDVLRDIELEMREPDRRAPGLDQPGGARSDQGAGGSRPGAGGGGGGGRTALRR